MDLPARTPGPSGFHKHNSREGSSKTGDDSECNHAFVIKNKTKLLSLIIMHVTMPTLPHKFLVGVSTVVKKCCITAETFLMLPSTNPLNSFNPPQTLQHLLFGSMLGSLVQWTLGQFLSKENASNF